MLEFTFARIDESPIPAVSPDTPPPTPEELTLKVMQFFLDKHIMTLEDAKRIFIENDHYAEDAFQIPKKIKEMASEYIYAELAKQDQAKEFLQASGEILYAYNAAEKSLDDPRQLSLAHLGDVVYTNFLELAAQRAGYDNSLEARSASEKYCTTDHKFKIRRTTKPSEPS